MKLIKCYISAFGKFRDFTYDFSDGLNVILHENGWGKTTLATFLKCIFYGINSKKRNIEENDRIKYAPWNYNDKFGGYVIFEKDGYVIKAERYFGKKESEDTLELIDVNTGKLFRCDEILGERIFRIDEEGFLSTVFFTQNDLTVKNTTSLSSKFNLSDPTDTKAFENAVDNLEKEIKKYSNSVNRGIIPDLKNKQYFLNEKIEQAKQADLTLIKVKEQESESKKQLKIVSQKLDQVNKDLKIASTNAVNKEKADTYKLLLEKKEKLLIQLNNVEKILNGNEVDKQEIEKHFNCVKDLSIAKERQSVLKDDLQTIENAKVNTNSNKTNLLYLNLLIIVCCVLGVAFASINIIATIILCGISAIGLTYVSYKYAVNNKKKTIENPLLEKKKKEYEEFSLIVKKQTEVLDCFFNRFNIDNSLDYYQKIETLKETLANLDKIQKDIAEIENQIKGYKSIDLTVNSSISSLDELQIELNDLQRLYSSLNSDLSRINTAILRYEELSYSLTDLVNEKMQVQEQIEQAIKKNELLKTTLKFLNQADDNLKVLYREPLSSALNKYLSLITSQEKGVNIDIDLNLTVNEKNGAKKPEYYSLGYQNLFEICKRFALIDVLYKDNVPFIVLDDPFTNLDEEKIKTCLEFIGKLSSERQIIYLTCHNSRSI